MAKCIVFGGHGFIGNHLVMRLLRAGHELKVFDIAAGELDFGSNDNLPIQITGDFLDYDAVNNAMKGMDYAFHYISVTLPWTSISEPIKEAKNLNGTLNILESAVENNITKLIYPSSGGTIYGEPEQLPVPEGHPLRPIIPYAITKATIENLMEFYYNQFGLDYTVLRISNPYGPGQRPKTGFGVIPTFYEEIKNDKPPVIFGDGTNQRDYLYISDVLEANIMAMGTQHKSRIYNVGSGVGVSLNQLVELMSKVTGKDVKPQYTAARKQDISKVYLDTTLIKQELGWHPQVDLETGLRKMWEWINK
ncbi:NAD-dependent epimerase/dehydratase family protein [[Eubacterium] cellulosolvens]